MEISDTVTELGTFTTMFDTAIYTTTSPTATRNPIIWSIGDCSSNQTSEHPQTDVSCCLNYGNHTLNCTNGGDGNYIKIQGRKYCHESTFGEISVQVDIKGAIHYLIDKALV